MSDEEWGNLGDFDANDPLATNRAAVNIRTKNNKEWRKNQKVGAEKRSNNKEWRKNHKKGMKEKWNNNEYHVKMKPVLKENRIKSMNKWKESRKEVEADPDFQKRKKESIRNSKICRPVITPYGRFESWADFVDFVELKTNNRIDHTRLGELPHIYYYENTGPAETLYETVHYSPWGVCRFRREVFRLAEKQKDAFFLSRRDKNKWWRYVCKHFPEQFYEKQEIKKDWNPPL